MRIFNFWKSGKIVRIIEKGLWKLNRFKEKYKSVRIKSGKLHLLSRIDYIFMK